MIMYLCARDINVPLSTSFLLTTPGERMIMYDIMFLFLHLLLTKPGERHDILTKRMIMYLCARDIECSSFYTFSIDQARRENDHVFVC